MLCDVKFHIIPSTKDEIKLVENLKLKSSRIKLLKYKSEQITLVKLIIVH